MNARSMRKANSAGTAAIAAMQRSETDAACSPASPDKPGPTLCSVSAHRLPSPGLTRLERTELALVEMIVNLRHLRDSLHQLGRLDLIGNPKLD